MKELVVDNFAGGGGASTGIERAIGRPVDVAINHSRIAIEMHRANHPQTHHYCEDIWSVDPREVAKGRPVGLAWFSPDCTHFSRAKGGKPLKKQIRGLAWVVVRWARTVRPRVIILENVPEFVTWGPLGPDDRPCPKRRGKTFRSWVGQLRDAGYAVEWRELVAAEYGAPTSRKRFFLIARCDGAPIVWPEATHGPRRFKPWRTAAECIDWSLPCPSIFERQRPLAENTLRRIAKGIRRYVLESPNPFIVTYYGPKREGEFRGCGMGDPLPTQPTENRFGLVTPFVTKYYGQSHANGVGEPLSTVSEGIHHGLTMPYLVQANHGGSEFRGQDAREPLPTVTSKHGYGVAIPTLIQTGYGEREGQEPRVPGLEKPLGTVVAGGGKHALCSAFLAQHFGGMVGYQPDRPLNTITAKDHHGLGVAYLSKLYGTSVGSDPGDPMPTVTGGGNHIAEVRAFLVAYYGSESDGQDLLEPMRTVTAKHRLGLVEVEGVDYQIVDIGLRMLQPRELARAQGFPDEYRLVGTKAQQVALIGNSVCPAAAEALVRANYVEAAVPAMGGVA